MVRTFAGLFLLGCVVFCGVMFGSYLLNRRWDRAGFYE